MADAVTTQTIIDGPKKSVIKFTNISDGTGESAVKKVDVSTLAGAPSKVTIERIIWATAGMAVDIYFDATANVLAFTCGDTTYGDINLADIGGIHNNAGTGVTGDILFTTRGHTAGDSYVVILVVRKS